MRLHEKIISAILVCLNMAVALGLMVSAHSDKLNPETYRFAPYFGLLFPLFLAATMLFLLLGIWRFRGCLAVSLGAMLISASAIGNFFPLSLLPAPAPANAIKVMTYNVQGYKLGSKPDKTTPSILKYISEQDPDICCLQEVYWVKKGDKVGEKLSYKAAFPQYKYVHFAQFDMKGWGNRSCLVLLSKYPIKKVHKVNYKSTTNASMVYELAINKTRSLTIINNHLQSNGLTNDIVRLYNKTSGKLDTQLLNDTHIGIIKKFGKGAKTRVLQATSIREEIDKAKGEVIVCGDFNDTQQSYAYRLIRKGNLLDAYIESGFGPGTTFNAHHLYFRIDHILYTPGLKSYASHIDKVLYSDHYPVTAYFTFE